MRNYHLLGAAVVIIALHGLVEASHCQLTNNNKTYFDFPKYPLSLSDLLGKVIPEGQTHSAEYYEVYSFDFKNATAEAEGLPPLPILRKTAIRWNSFNSVNSIDFTNDYTGWIPFADACENGVIEFDPPNITIPTKDMWLFEFDVVYPTAERYIGTSYSSCPERYLINWYCSKEELHIRGSRIVGCNDQVRMSIYSATALDRLPWHLVIEDMCKNKAPKLDDYRWTFTHDAPTQCPLDTVTGRKKRSTKNRHYL